MAYSGNTNNSNRGGGRPVSEGFEQVLEIRRVSKKLKAVPTFPSLPWWLPETKKARLALV